MPITTSVLDIVSKAAPLLGTVLGTPAAGVGIKMLVDAFGVKDEALSHAIANDPMASVKLKALELEHAEMLAKIASTDYAREVEDRVDARNHAQTYGMFTIHMAYLVTAIFVLALIMVFLPISVDGMDRDLLSMLIGMLVSKWQTIMDFFFGGARPQNKPYTGSDEHGKG